MATTSWFVVYGLCYSTSKLNYDSAIDLSCPSEWQYFFTAIVVCMIFANCMVLSKPLTTLSPVRPTFRLFSLRTLLSFSVAVFFYAAVMIVGESVLSSRPWYRHVNLLDIGAKPHQWTQRSNNYDSAFWVLSQITHLVFVGFMFSFGFRHRQPVYKNWALIFFGVLILVWVFLLAWGRPNNFTCLFAINCDTVTSMNAELPFFTQMSVNALGSCFCGPQLKAMYDQLYSEDESLNRWQFPDKNTNGCVVDTQAGDDGGISFDHFCINCDSDVGSQYYVDGPNNVWFDDFKIAFTILVTIGYSLMVLVYWLVMSYTPGNIRHFSRY